MYHIAQPGKFGPDELIHVQAQPGGTLGIYLHPLHARSELARGLNRLTRHQVGNGLWRHRVAGGGRMPESAEGERAAASRWELVPASALPSSITVMTAEEEGACVWLIRERACTRPLRDAVNATLERLARDGLWVQYWYEPPQGASRGARPAPGAGRREGCLQPMARA
ncbi:hypothetical protein ABZZ79_03480 [Streptomyces sp. NPDC006458]|uniref:hypothetical protein n=1 Tax=Streptomyces sp. NPDC006458 TaxID=3154302 RepID=UPI0033A1F5DD